ncbi:MAG: preprotein translocase subunit SecG [Crocinitomicaceae bacterium]
MGSLLTILVIIGCIGIILFVLVQNPKGGGLNSEFGSAVQLGGAKRATDILEKGTWGLAIAIALMCLIMARPSAGVQDADDLETNPDAVESNEVPPGGGNVPPTPGGFNPGNGPQ